MLAVLWIIWGFLCLTIPAALFKANNTFISDDTSVTKKIIKLIISLLAHLIISFVTFFLFIFFIFGPEPRRGQEIDLVSKVSCLILVLFYGITGWLLVSFVYGKFITSLKPFIANAEKPQSIFDSK